MNKMTNPRLIKLAGRWKNAEAPAMRELEEPSRKIREASTEVTGIEDLTGFWRVHGVDYRNSTHTVDLQKALLDGGTAKTQDEWAEYSRQAKVQGEFYVGDLPLYHSLFTALFRNKDGDGKETAEQARSFLQKEFFDKWLMTLTRITYAPGGDKIEHNYGMPDKYTLDRQIIGPDEYAKDAVNGDVYEAILGAGNTAEIQEVYKWITGKDAYLWRVNSKPEKEEVRVAGFDAISDGAYLNCNRNPRLSNSALGVREGISAEGASR